MGTADDHAEPAKEGGRAALRMWPGLAFDCGATLALALLALLVGCLVNALRAEPLPWVYASRSKTMEAAVAGLTADRSPQTTAQTATVPVREILLEDFQAFVMEGKGLVLDARPKVFYGLGHIPGAVSLPREAFAEEYPRLREKLETHKDQPVAVYCSGAECPDSQLLANALVKLGYRQVLIYTSGWEEWSQTGLPQEGTSTRP